jgi:hypothetical integral membrane protein (TIGR02206 family)
VQKFQIFGLSHVTALVITLFFILFVIFFGNKYKDKKVEIRILYLLSFLILSGMLLKLGYNWYNGKFALPMQLCDWAAFLVVYVLFTGDRRLFEPAYFWGMGGTLQALFTPDVKLDFPDIKFFTFFLLHCGVVAGIFYLIFVKKLYPGPGGIKRVFVISQFYIIVALIINYFAGTNYGYLAKKPSGASILDLLGPWPIYIAGIEIAGLIICLLLYIPFVISGVNKNP